jgi:2-polyprenyl-3-methyl-5-hydroxy-6-metoxy-1,4-benzoquinol methylase
MSSFDSHPALEGRPNLAAVCVGIAERSRFQKKSVLRTLDAAAPQFLDFAEDWVTRLLAAMPTRDVGRLAQDYVAYTKMIRIEEMHFRAEQEYRYRDFDEVYQRVYGSDAHMSSYVTGLGLTQLFWPNHYAVVRFYLDRFLPHVTGARRGAEIGVGHGLFHSELLRAAPQVETKMLDISPVSLGFTHRVITATGLDNGRAQKSLVDIQKDIPVEDGSLDALLMGEVVEHLEHGEAVMRAMSSKMAPGGRCFFTTAANAPAEDHILLFRTSAEIRAFLSGCGWEILDEHIDPIGDIPLDQAEAEGHNINYAATLKARA